MADNESEYDTVLCRCSSGDSGHLEGVYEIAGTRLLSTFEIPALQPFRIANHPYRFFPRILSQPVGPTQRSTTVEAWLAGSRRTVVCSTDDDSYLLRVNPIGEYRVCRNHIIVPDSNIQSNGEIITGPCLMLILALRGIFTLHASGIVVNNGAVALAGESASGKSTLARWVYEQSKSRRDCFRIADDLLPTTECSNRINVLPHFPQLKLAVDDYYPDRNKPSIPMRALIVLAGGDAEAIHLQALSGREAMLAMIRHTVASRLFGPRLNRAHMAFAARFAAAMPIYRLRYPRRFDVLPAVIERINALVTD